VEKSPYQKVLIVDDNTATTPTTTTTSSSTLSPRLTTTTTNNKNKKNKKRTIGYAICESKDPQHRKTAILWFYPLCTSSLIVDSAAESGSFDTYKASIISVDRPGVANTTDHHDHHHHNNNNNSAAAVAVERIEQHAMDVMAVLAHHSDIEHVYLLGVCLGHPFAVQVARQILLLQQQQQQQQQSKYKLMGMTFVAPFVSTKCPHAWRVARLGASVPSLVLRIATKTLTWIMSASMATVLTAAQLKKLITDEEQNEFKWNHETDFERAVSMALRMNDLSRNATAVEAQLGADPSWQNLCDEFAKENNCWGSNNNDSNNEATTTTTTENTSSTIPIVIHACREDIVTPLESVIWVARRCYGGDTVVSINERVHSHEIMTMLGGPPGNPVMMHDIARSWGLL